MWRLERLFNLLSWRQWDQGNDTAVMHICIELQSVLQPEQQRDFGVWGAASLALLQVQFLARQKPVWVTGQLLRVCLLCLPGSSSPNQKWPAVTACGRCAVCSESPQDWADSETWYLPHPPQNHNCYFCPSLSAQNKQMTSKQTGCIFLWSHAMIPTSSELSHVGTISFGNDLHQITA